MTNPNPKPLTREQRALGGRRGGAALREKCRRSREVHEWEIVAIVRRSGGLKETRSAYREYVARAIWSRSPILTYRWFQQLVASAEHRGFLRKVVVMGNGGTFSFLEIPR